MIGASCPAFYQEAANANTYALKSLSGQVSFNALHVMLGNLIPVLEPWTYGHPPDNPVVCELASPPAQPAAGLSI